MFGLKRLGVLKNRRGVLKICRSLSGYYPFPPEVIKLSTSGQDETRWQERQGSDSTAATRFVLLHSELTSGDRSAST